MIDHPLLFAPLYQERVWGGRQLETRLKRTLPRAAQPYGESWDLVDRIEANSTVISGTLAGKTLHELWTQHRSECFGDALLHHPSERFPLLMKILDARDDLSIQVHPPASIAEALAGESKTEMWFIAHAEPGAKIYAGLKAGVSRESFELALHEGTVADQIHLITPKTGDCLFIPSGRVHAIGAGLLIYEIQQNSDTTYRVFDWNRLGLDGQPRALHIAESLASIDFTDFEPSLQTHVSDGPLVSCEFFDVFLRSTSTAIATEGQCSTVAVTRGHLIVGQSRLQTGDFALMPAALSNSQRRITDSSSDAQWLEVVVRAK